jgi:hypothetical protein
MSIEKKLVRGYKVDVEKDRSDREYHHHKIVEAGDRSGQHLSTAPAPHNGVGQGVVRAAAI